MMGKAVFALALVLPAALQPATASGEGGGGGVLLPCGTSGGSDPGGDSRQVLDVFHFVQGVCEQLGETCPTGQFLPSSCASTECQRAVQLAVDSCDAVFSKDGFLKTAFGPPLDDVVAVCASAPHPEEGQSRAITGHATPTSSLLLEAQDGGLLTDGMGSGHSPSSSGTDYAEVQARPGQIAQVDVLALWLSKGNQVRVTVDGGEQTTLQGTALPPAEGGGRRFRSKPGGKIGVLLVTDELKSLSFFSLAVRAACADTSGCGGHGVCSSGNCTCSSDYTGMGCQCLGSHFPCSRLLTPEWGQQLNDWAGMGATQEWVMCYSSLTDDVETPTTFHAQCNRYNRTISIAHNEGNNGSNPGNYTFGGFAVGSWGIDQCCRIPGNDCNRKGGYCYAHAASEDFLFSLWNPKQPTSGPQRFLPNRPPPPGIIPSEYQRVEPTSWPRWGMGNSNTDLHMGGNERVGGRYANCYQGHSYAGAPGEICGGSGWGDTQFEVWRPRS